MSQSTLTSTGAVTQAEEMLFLYPELFKYAVSSIVPLGEAC